MRPPLGRPGPALGRLGASQLRRPPDRAPDVVEQRGNQQGTDEERVEQDAERHDERDLQQEQDRDDRERRERRRKDEARRRDHPAGHHQPADDAGPGPVGAGLLAHAGGEEDVVVDPKGDQEHEAVQRDRRIRAGEVEHLEELSRSAISEDWARELGIYTAYKVEDLPDHLPDHFGHETW